MPFVSNNLIDNTSAWLLFINKHLMLLLQAFDQLLHKFGSHFNFSLIYKINSYINVFYLRFVYFFINNNRLNSCSSIGACRTNCQVHFRQNDGLRLFMQYTLKSIHWKEETGEDGGVEVSLLVPLQLYTTTTTLRTLQEQEVREIRIFYRTEKSKEDNPQKLSHTLIRSHSLLGR